MQENTCPRVTFFIEHLRWLLLLILTFDLAADYMALTNLIIFFLSNHLLIVCVCGTYSSPLFIYIKCTSWIYALHQDLINLSCKNYTWLTDSLTPSFAESSPPVRLSGWLPANNIIFFNNIMCLRWRKWLFLSSKSLFFNLSINLFHFIFLKL